MKVVKKIILWVMISLTLQFAGLFYIDKYFLASGGTRIKAKKKLQIQERKIKIMM